VAGLEPPAAVQPSLTTLDGPAHTALRQAHAPLFTARRLRAHLGRMTELARELLTAVAGEDQVDLAADFTARYPVAVLLDLLGIPLDRVDDAMGACRAMFTGPEGFGRAMAIFADLAAAGLTDGRSGLAAELRDRVPAEITRDHLHYLIFGLIFPGKITTDPALGFVLADVLDHGRAAAELDDLVRETLRHHPPAPLTLWRFTTEEVELAGVHLPPRAPVLVDILGIGTDPQRLAGSDLTFGAGAHHCLGAQLAALELQAVGAVVRSEFPDARLAVPRSVLCQVSFGGIGGSRLVTLPVVLGRPRSRLER
jgi:cytochrome P450